MSSWKITGAALAVAAIVASTSIASQQGRNAGAGRAGRGLDRNERWTRLLSHVDANADGKVSREEFLARHAGFDRMDRDGDGVASQQEIALALHYLPRLSRIVQRVDANHDGEITGDEVREKRAALFDKLDDNHDASVDKGEFMSFVPERQREHDGSGT